MAEVGAHLLFERIKGKTIKAELYEIDTIFTQRGSGEL
jgi:hypothetical protein